MQKASDVTRSILNAINQNDNMFEAEKQKYKKIGNFRRQTRDQSRSRQLNISCNSIITHMLGLPLTTTNIIRKQGLFLFSLDNLGNPCKSNKENKQRIWRIKNVQNNISLKNQHAELKFLPLAKKIEQKIIDEQPKPALIVQTKEQFISSSYYKDILEHLLSREVLTHENIQQKCIEPFPSYLHKSYQTSLEQFRKQIIRYLIEVHQKLKLQQDTLFLSVSIFDRTIYQQLANVYTQVEDEQLIEKMKIVVLASLFIAGKIEEVYQIPSMKVHMNNSIQQDFSTGMQMLHHQSGHSRHGRGSTFSPILIVISIFQQNLARVNSVDSQTSFLLELCLIESQLTRFLPSTIVLSCINVAEAILKQSIPKNSFYQVRIQKVQNGDSITACKTCINGLYSAEIQDAKSLVLQKYEQILDLQKWKFVRMM